MELAQPYRMNLAAVAQEVRPLRPGAPTGAAIEAFEAIPNISCLAVVDEFERPVGLVSRASLSAAVGDGASQQDSRR